MSHSSPLYFVSSSVPGYYNIEYFVPVLSIKASTCKYYGGITVNEPNTSDFKTLQQTNSVKGICFREEGNIAISVEGKYLFDDFNLAQAAAISMGQGETSSVEYTLLRLDDETFQSKRVRR